jgi:hypothetical protein
VWGDRKAKEQMLVATGFKTNRGMRRGVRKTSLQQSRHAGFAAEAALEKMQ